MHHQTQRNKNSVIKGSECMEGLLFVTVSGRQLQQGAESLKAISLWRGNIIFPLSSWSPADGTDMDDEDGDDV